MRGLASWTHWRLLLLGAAVALGAGCSHGSSTSPASGGAEQASAATPTPPPSPRPAPPNAEGQVSSPLKPRPSLPGIQTVTAAPELVPPSGVGEVRMEAEGCLAQPTRGSAFPPPAQSRSLGGGSQVRVTPVPRGITLLHPLEHACCLTARAQAQVEGQSVTVIETLEGEPCRCRCGSTVRSAVALAPGTYTLHVVVREPGGERTLFEGPVSVSQ